MKATYFSNKKSLQVISHNIKNDIQTQIKNIGTFNLTSKYYTFLNKKNVNNLKENNFLVSLSTFGKKFILFITKYNTKKYCIFINKKNDVMNVVQLKFTDDIFLGTLFDGELVKNSDDKWIYLINDIAYYKGKNVITKSFQERENIIEEILKNENQAEENETLFISKKRYFEYNKIEDLVENYMGCLNYKCSGLYFKSLSNFSDNYLFIFPECRSDSKILNDTENIETKETKDTNEKSKDEVDMFNDDEVDLFKDVDVINDSIKESSNKNLMQPTNIRVEENIKETIKRSENEFKEKRSSTVPKLEKTTCRFLINKTMMPDIYELYCRNNKNYIEKNSYASVPDMETSQFIKNLFPSDYNMAEDLQTKINNNKAIYVECNYHKNFKKWVPYKRVDTIDTINTINQTQIILDSL